MADLVINNVQTGTIAFSASDTSKTATLTSVDTSKCFILIDWQTTEGSVQSCLFRGVLTNSTTITVDRDTAAGTATIRWWAIEFSAGLTVSHFTGTAKNTNTAIGSTVDLGKTFGILSYTATGFALDDEWACAVDIVSTTNFQVKDVPNTGSIAWAVQIIEFDSDADPVVRAATITLASAVTSNSATITAVTIANSMVIGGGTFDGAGSGQARRVLFDWALTSTTNLQISRSLGLNEVVGYLFVVDWGANVDIRGGTDTLTSVEGTSETQTFSALGSTDDAVAFIRGGAPTFGAKSNNVETIRGDHFIEAGLDSTTQITISRSLSALDFGPYVWQVIDFAGFVAAGGANTKDKRFSMLNFGTGTTPHLLPDPDGTFDLGDKQHFLDCYSGIAFASGGAVFDESISLSGQGDLTLIASVVFNALLQLNGQGDFILANTLTLEELLTLSGQGDLQVTGNLDIEAALQLDGQGNLVLTPNLAIDALANLSAQGSISFDPELVMGVALTLSGQGDLTLIDTVSFEEGVTFNGQGNLVLSPELLAEAALTLSVDAALALLASVIIDQSIALTGQGNVTFIGGLDVQGAITLDGLGDLTTSRTVTFDNAVALGGIGDVAFVRTVILNEPVVINAQADITADRNVVITGSIPLGGQGGVALSTQLDAEGTITFTAQADLADVGSLTMEEIVSIAVNAALTLLATTQESSIINKINLSGVKISEIGLRGVQEQDKTLSGEFDITVTLQGKVDR